VFRILGMELSAFYGVLIILYCSPWQTNESFIQCSE